MSKWHKWPDEKPTETGYYIVKIDKGTRDTCYETDFYRSKLENWNWFASRVQKWTEVPEED